MVVFITGKAGAGKTTVARKLKKRLEARGRAVLIFDGDEVREQRDDCGYSDQDRLRHIVAMADFAAIAERQGFMVIIAAIMPKEYMRLSARLRVKKACLVHVKGGILWANTVYQEPSKEEREGLYYEIQSYDR